MATQEKSNERMERGAQQGESQGIQRREGRGLARRGLFEGFTSPDEFFLMNPFSLMKRMTDEMNRIFGEAGATARGTTWVPAIEVTQRDNKYMVTAELPGLKPEDVKINVEDDALTIEGERRFEREETREGAYRSERRYGRFYRAVPLPDGAKTDQAQARFENGVLEIQIPVEEQAAKRKQIPISGGSEGRRAA